MSYEIIDPHRVPKPEFVRRFAEIADRAWRGYSDHPLSWRYEYYSALANDWIVAQRFFRITEFINEKNGRTEDCAFITVLPMKVDACRLHRRGILSQYDFSDNDFRISRSRTEKSFHYVQSMFSERSHHQSFILKKMLKESVFSLLKGQYCGFNGRPYVIYAETSMKHGRELALKHGFIESDERSHEGRPFFVFDSETQNIEMSKHIGDVWK